MPVSLKELEKVWKEITENKKVDKIDYGMFKRFFENHDSRSSLNR